MLLAIFLFGSLQPQVLAQIQPGCNVSTVNDYIVATCDNLSLQEVPTNLPRNISVLSFSFNQLTNLTDQLVTNDCDLNHTAYLWCSRFPNIEYLNLSNSDIKIISNYSLFGMEHLKKIDIGKNILENLPSHIFRSNRYLFYVDVSGNNIKFIHPEVFKNLWFLQVLLISNNRIVDLHPETFDGLLSLRYLWLDNNAISRLSPELFKNLGNLRQFNVNHNRLKCISQDSMDQLPDLREIGASHNQITFLSPAIFSNNINLQIVDLSHNLIRKLSKYTSLDLIKKKAVDLSFNHIESLYLSYLPVSFKSRNKRVELDMNTDLCLDHIGVKYPCFLTYENDIKENCFHWIDFSHNNIKTLKYSNSKVAHSLEFANISLASNKKLEIKASFFKTERFVTRLNLDGTNFNWKNLTLINELLDLPYLKILSVVGTGICEYYTRQVLSSIFNPNMHVNVIYDGPITEDLLTNLGMLKNKSVSYIIEDTIELGIINSTDDDITKCLEVSNAYNASSLCSFECECYADSTVTLKKFYPSSFEYPCAYTLDCSYYSFTTLPDIKSNISCIFLSHNNFERIEQDYFNGFHEIKLLDLSYNYLNYLPDKVFNNLFSLEVLSLDNNNLTSIPPNLFKYLSKLNMLTLHGNSISSYNSHAFVETPHLVVITIDFANLDNLHDVTFQNMSYLSFLRVRENTRKSGHKNIVTTEFLKYLCTLQSLSVVGFNLSESFNCSILCSKHMETLELKGNYLPVLTDDIFSSLGDINKINVPANGIQSLGHHTFRNLTKVKYIDISCNSIEVLHASLFSDMQQLQFLNVSHNKISCVYVAMFQNSPMLFGLDISFNRIVFIDSNIFKKFYNLKFVLLNNNNITVGGETHFLNEKKTTCIHVDILGNRQELYLNITDIESVSQRNQSIVFINISNNTFELLDETMFIHNRFLKQIIASYNSIHHISNGTFKNSGYLEKIELNDNELVVINASIFKNLTLLNSLALQRNRIEFIEHGAFQDLKALEFLWLSNNRLKTFDPTSLPRSLKTISLSNNYIIINNSNAYQLKSLKELYLNYNPLKNVIVDDFFSFPSLVVLVLDHTNIHKFSTEAFRNTTSLLYLKLRRSCVHSLSGHHFYNLRRLLVLDISKPRTHGCAPGTNNVLSWKNITLINSWFEHAYLQYLNLAGHDICKDLSWNQVINNIFLSETWKIVFCSEETELPQMVLSPDAHLLLNWEIIPWQ